MIVRSVQASEPLRSDSGSRLQGQAGSTLVLALAFTTIIMSLTVAVLGFARAGTHSIKAYQVERNRRYAVDGALQTAVQMVASNYRLGVTGNSVSDPCSMRFQIRDPFGSQGQGSITDGYVLVECAPTNTAISGGDSGTGDPQIARDVTFVVKCNTDFQPQGTIEEKLTCGSGSVTSKVIGRARVRFEPDFTMTSATDRVKRAVIPKIISWEVRN